jgi:RHS repeat-associated protein
MTPRSTFARLAFLTFVVAGLILSVPGSSRSGAVTVFGPRTYTRSAGRPVVVTDRFDVARPGAYTLVIDNGGAHRQLLPVTSAVVALDGRIVVDQDDLRRLLPVVRRRVVLAARNVLSVEILGAPRSGFTLQIVGPEGPVANAGPDQTVTLGATVQLDGSASHGDGPSLSFRWSFVTRPAGSAASLSDATAVKPTFVADKPGRYVVQLVVNDGHVDSAPDLVTLTTGNAPPVANAGPDQTVTVGTVVTLDGTRSSDADGDPLTFLWTLTPPAGSAAALSDRHAVRPTFLVDRAGAYDVTLVVNDGKVDGAPDSVRVSTVNSPPVAAAGPDQTIARGATVQLDGTASSDVDGDALTFRWSFQSRPAGSQATLTDPAADRPAFVADVSGRYVVTLVVNDGQADSKPDTVQVDTENSRPVANAGADQAVTLGATVQLDGSSSADADHDPLTFRWSFTTRPAGSAAVLLDADGAQPTFAADQLGTYVAQLIVNDGQEDSLPDTVAITAQPANRAPVVDAGPDQTITLPTDSVTLAGAVGDDGLPGGPLVIAWTVVSAPGTVTFGTPAQPATTARFSASGRYVLRLSASDGALSASDDVAVTVSPAQPVNQPPTVSAGADQAITLPAGATLVGTVADDGLPDPPAAVTTTWSVVSGPGSVAFADAAATSTTATFSTSGAYVLRLSASDGALSASADVSITVSPASGGGGGDGGLPPDPATVAPPAPAGVATTMADGTRFLYSGPNPIQTGVAPDTIELKRAAVVRGRVLDRTGAPLAGVSITILNRPEFGQTLSRADGRFDMAVNGGGALVVDFRATGFLGAQRRVAVPWQQFVTVPDTTLVTLDPNVTAVTLDAPAMQVARGSAVTDADGSRRTTLLFPAGTTASLVMPDGSSQPATSLHVRATEYTIGPSGPSAMPGALPPTSGYTYAVELSADEALAAGARGVAFGAPIVHYVENFLNFPVGIAVPVGFYDRGLAAWVASDNGRVIRIAGVTAGLADVDTVGGGSLPAVTLTDAERAQLATLYPIGQALWRVPIPHFSPLDCNWPVGPPPPDPPGPAPGPPPGPGPQGGNGDPDDNECPQSGGSTVACHRQVLGEAVPVTGTGYGLHYASDRVPGWGAEATIKIPLSGPTLSSPPPKRIDLVVSIAGREFQQSFAPAPNLTTTFQWDGLNVYGRAVEGGQVADVRVGNVYDAVYRSPADIAKSFGLPGDVILSGNRARQEYTIATDWTTTLTRRGTRMFGLGGWSLGVHHVFDPNGGVLYLGTGERQTGKRNTTIQAAVGSGRFCATPPDCGDGGPATQAQLSQPFGLAVAPNGDLYFADRLAGRVGRVGADGVVRTVAGMNGVACSPTAPCGDGGPATAAQLNLPYSVAVGGDGSLYIADAVGHRIRKVGLDGIITTVAGNGVQCGFGAPKCGDGGPATAANLFQPQGIAIGTAGELYIADSGSNLVRRVGPDGIISTIAGPGPSASCLPGSPCGDGGPATAARVVPEAIAVGPDGSVYISDLLVNRIRRIAPDGTLTSVAGSGGSCTFFPVFTCGENGPATAAALGRPEAIAFAPGGALYIADSTRNYVWRLDPDGIIHIAVGTSSSCVTTGAPCGDGGLAIAATFNLIFGVAIAPDGSLYVSDFGANRIRRVDSAYPGVALTDIVLPSSDGSEVYVFDGIGRHLRTHDALTGAVRVRFAYDADGQLTSVTDAGGNTTTIERGVSGPTGIVSPHGQRTTLTVGGGGFLTSISDPAGHSLQLAARPDGLLDTLIDSRGAQHHFSWDDVGRLVRDEDGAGHVITLARTETPTGHSVVATASGQTTTYTLQRLPNGAQQLLTTFANGTSSQAVANLDGSTVQTFPDGTKVVSTFAPDPRWRMQAPLLASQTLTTPGGRSQVVTRSRALTLSSPASLLDVRTLNESLTIDGHTTTTSYDAAARTVTIRTPAGRTTVLALDGEGRIMLAQPTGLEPVSFGYTADGRVASLTEGTGGSARRTTLVYGGSDPGAAYLVRVDDPLGRSRAFAYDAAGRATQQTLPGGLTVSYQYDAGGNITTLTPPGGLAHSFAYGADGQITSYTPPPIAGGGGATRYDYNSAGRVARVTQPDGQAQDISYDDAGRLSRLTYPGGVIGLAFAANGQLQSVSGPSGQRVDYTLDGFLPLDETWSGPIAGSVARTLDNGLRVITRTVNGVAITLGYDADSLLTAAGDLSLSRDPGHGRVTATTLGTVTDARSYSGFGGLAHYTASVSGSPIYDTQLARDALGRITSRAETIGGTTDTYAYSYDGAGRLVQASRNGVPATYSYDANGNRLTANGVAATYDGQDRLITLGTTSYASTVNGEIVTKTAGGQVTRYTYDALGNLLGVELPDGTRVGYLIDGLSRRIGRTLDGTLVQGFLYDERGRLVAELDGAGAVVSRFVYASRPNVPDYMVRGGAAYRLVSDHLGSVRLVVKSDTGAIAQRLDYDTFGAVTGDTSPGFQPFGFGGGLYDRHTGLVRFGTRDYDAETGRWTTRDPILFGSGRTNLYLYASNDPVNRLDGTGLDDAPGNGGVCLGPPPNLSLPKPKMSDPIPKLPTPSFCPTCATQAEKNQHVQDKPAGPRIDQPDPSPSSSSSDSGPSVPSPKIKIGPFSFSGGPNSPSPSDLKDKDAFKWVNKFEVKAEANLNADSSLSSTDQKPGSPDPNGPAPKPQGPQCQASLDKPDPLGCEN